MELVKSPVVFDQKNHTYTLDGKQLQGITGMLGRQLFPDKYKDVPVAVLKKAQEKGSLIHEICELIDELGTTHECPEASKYMELKELYGLRHEASEYIVSDEENFASAIDKVYRETDNEFTLGDIKTTYRLDMDYVRWQLSVYAYLFELQNPECKAVRLLAIWLRGEDSCIAEVQRIDNETVSSLLRTEVEGKKFLNPLTVSDCALPERYRSMEREMADIAEQARYWTERKKELCDGLMREMVKSGAYSWKGDTVSVVRKKDSIRKDFDRKAFERDYPDLYRKYIKETPVLGSITLKVS